ERLALALGQNLLVEIVDQLVKQLVPVDPRLEVPEHRAEADGRTVHEHKGARRRDATEFADLSMHAVDQPDAVRRAVPPLLDHARAVVEQWAVDERGPAVQHLDHLARKIAESPTLIRIDRQLVIVAFERVVEIDDAADEAGRENA